MTEPPARTFQTSLAGEIIDPYYDPPGEEYDLTYLSFGAGVQSTALLIMSALELHGVPKADYAVFADTQAEIQETYDHIERMKEWVSAHGIEVVTVSLGSLEQDVLVGGVRGNGISRESIPAYVKKENGKRGILQRRCTWDYKIVQIQKKVRELLGLEPGQVAKGKYRVRAMLGISTDEADRMKPSREPWIFNAYPLIDAGLDRDACKQVITAAGIPEPPKSSCWFCPFHRDDYWLYLKNEHPEFWDRSLEFDRKIRHTLKGVVHPAYLHDSLIPLEQVQLEKGRSDVFSNECTGYCGV